MGDAGYSKQDGVGGVKVGKRMGRRRPGDAVHLRRLRTFVLV